MCVYVYPCMYIRWHRYDGRAGGGQGGEAERGAGGRGGEAEAGGAAGIKPQAASRKKHTASRKKQAAASSKQQAASRKPQAASRKEQAARQQRASCAGLFASSGAARALVRVSVPLRKGFPPSEPMRHASPRYAPPAQIMPLRATAAIVCGCQSCSSSLTFVTSHLKQRAHS